MNEFFRRYQGALILIALLIIGLSLLLSSIREKSSFSFPERVVIAVFAPFQDAVGWVAISTATAWDNYIMLVDVEKENDRLRKKVARLSFENNALKESVKSYQRIEKLLSFPGLATMGYVTARVISQDITNRSHIVTINRGTNDQIKEEAPVFNHTGLVGKVVRVTGSASKVLLLTNVRSAVDAVAQNTRDRLVVAGANGPLLKTMYLAANAQVKNGDLIVSSGLGGVFPKGMVIGSLAFVHRSEDSLFLEAWVEPSVDFNKIEELLALTSRDEENNR